MQFVVESDGYGCAEHDFAGTVAGEIIERGWEEGSEVHLDAELDDEDWVWAPIAWDVPIVLVCGFALSLVPAGEYRRPVSLQASETSLAEVFDEILGGKAKHGRDGSKVGRTRLFEVPA